MCGILYNSGLTRQRGREFVKVTVTAGSLEGSTSKNEPYVAKKTKHFRA